MDLLTTTRKWYKNTHPVTKTATQVYYTLHGPFLCIVQIDYLKITYYML